MDEFIILLNIMILVIGLKICIGVDGHGGQMDGIMVGIGLMRNQIIIITIIFLINMIELNIIRLEFESGYWEDTSHNYNGSYDWYPHKEWDGCSWVEIPDYYIYENRKAVVGNKYWRYIDQYDYYPYYFRYGRDI